MASKRQAIIAVIVVIVLVAAGMIIVMGSDNKTGAAAGPFVIDAAGNNVSISQAPVRIVSSSPSITELVYALGSGKELVAVTDFCTYPADVVSRKENHTLASIGGFSTPSWEDVANATPDLVLVEAGDSQAMSMTPHFDAVGIKYVVLYEAKNLTKVYDNIELMGKVLHQTQAASNLTATMQLRLSNILTSIGNQTSKPKVMMAVYFDPGSSLFVAGGQTFIDGIITGADGVNTYGNVPDYPDVSRESAVQSNPDYIVVAATMNLQKPQEMYDLVMNDTLLKNTNAVKNGNVFIIVNQAENSFLHGADRLVYATQIMAEILYPTVFHVSIPHILSDDFVNYLPQSWTANTTAAHMAMVNIAR